MSEVLSALEYPHLQQANSMQELINTPTHGENNLVILQHNLTINFQPLADKLANEFLQPNDNDTYLPFSTKEILGMLESVAPEEKEAINQIRKDLKWLPTAYLQLTRRTENYGEFHIDGEGKKFHERIMYVYAGATTEFIDEKDSSSHKRVSHKRVASPKAQVYAVPNGYLWKHACENSNAQPFVHKAPSRLRVTQHNKNRLLLVEDKYYE